MKTSKTEDKYARLVLEIISSLNYSSKIYVYIISRIIEKLKNSVSFFISFLVIVYMEGKYS